MAAAFLALGDSYTIGEGVARSDAWPAQLAARLRASGFDPGEPEIIATTGWTTGELAEAIATRDPASGRQLVTLLIGVNNQYRGLPLDDYRREFADLLESAIGFAGNRVRRVLVVSIPDWGVTRFAAQKGVDADQVAAAIDAFNAAACALTLARGARWHNVTAISRGIARDLLAADGLHPSTAQYTLWAASLLPEVVKALAPD
ncbi:MAG: SGNH/GDSL hydrolase family protein [Xanthomonadales bacterium]|nr:SGNH/GDSL hydrolase family protein [Xanthomonadales bacterium]